MFPECSITHALTDPHSLPHCTPSSCNGGPREKVGDDVLEERQIVFEKLRYLGTVGDFSSMVKHNQQGQRGGASAKVRESMTPMSKSHRR